MGALEKTARAAVFFAGGTQVRADTSEESEGTMQDHYAALGLASSASLADIKKAFRQQAALTHPDRNPSPDAAQRFRAVQEAYEVLADEEKRKTYDENRRRGLLDSPIDTAAEIWQNYMKEVLK
jgi:curved DNA-binding protein CbpA